MRRKVISLLVGFAILNTLTGSVVGASAMSEIGDRSISEKKSSAPQP